MLWIVFTLASLVFGQTCNTVTRRGWVQLSNADKQKYFAGVRCLQAWRSPTGQGSVYDDFVKSHLRVSEGNGFMAHNNPAFLPWHRGMLMAFERALRLCTGDDTFFVPYWDSSRDDLRSSVVLRDFGGNGNSRNRSCISQGPFVGFRPYSPTGGPCITRGARNGVVATVEFLATISQERFDGFVRMIEQGTHSAVHNGIGGDMLTFASPNDPLFFLHHAFIDKIWADYQRQTSQGVNAFDPIGFGVRTSTRMPYYEISWLWGDRTVGEYMDISRLCYSYANTWSVRSVNISSVPPEQQHLLKLEIPAPLSEEWIRSQHFDVAEVRRLEKIQADLINYLNSIDGYVSPSAPIYRLNAPESDRPAMTDAEAQQESQLLDSLLTQAKKALNLPPEISQYIRTRLNDAIDQIHNQDVENALSHLVNTVF